MEKDTNLTVAKICHEIANYLSVLNFIKEDTTASATCDLGEMYKIIDLLAYTMDFFRNVYTDNIDSKAVINSLKKIYLLKDINLFITSESSMHSLPEKVQGAICCILYTIMKSSQSGDIVAVSSATDKFIINIPENINLSTEASKALSGTTQSNAFNILINYAQNIASLEGYKIKLEDNSRQVVIWKQ